MEKPSILDLKEVLNLFQLRIKDSKCFTKYDRQPQFENHYQVYTPILAHDNKNNSDVLITQFGNSRCFFALLEFHLQIPSYIGLSSVCGYYFNPCNSIIFSYYKNGSLANFYLNKTFWTPTFQSIIIFQTAATMMHLHSCYVVHRLLKPSVIMLDANYDIKITDFFVSEVQPIDLINDLSKDSDLFYVAPELIAHASYATEKCDVYSFGFILLSIVLGNEQFYEQKLTKEQIIDWSKDINKRPRIPSDTPPLIESMIRHCWDPNPTKRPSYAQIIRALMDSKAPFSGADNEEYKKHVTEYLKQASIRKQDLPLLKRQTNSDRSFSQTTPQNHHQIQSQQQFHHTQQPQGQLRHPQNQPAQQQSQPRPQQNQPTQQQYQPRSQQNQPAQQQSQLRPPHNQPTQQQYQYQQNYPSQQQYQSQFRTQQNQQMSLHQAQSVQQAQQTQSQSELEEAQIEEEEEEYSDDTPSNSNNSALIDRNAELNIRGMSILNKVGVRSNSSNVFLLFREAAENGSLEGKYNCAICILQGLETAINEVEGENLLKSLIDQGFIPAMNAMGDRQEEKAKVVNGDAKITLLNEALSYYTKSIAYGNTEALIKAANIYKTLGEPVKALEYLKNAANLGDEMAANDHAMLLITAMDNFDQGLNELVQNANKGNRYSRYNLGYLLYFGHHGLQCDKVRAREYFAKAADAEYPPAYHFYAKMLASGEGTPLVNGQPQKNFQEAEKFYQKAINNQIYSSFLNYAKMLQERSHDGMEQRLDRAAAFLKIAADAGTQRPNAIAMFRYAACLEHGLGVTQDLTLAGVYYRKSYQYGYKEAEEKARLYPE